MHSSSEKENNNNKIEFLTCRAVDFKTKLRKETHCYIFDGEGEVQYNIYIYTMDILFVKK